MIDIFDIMKTLKNKRIRMKGEITSGIGFYNKNNINTFIADLCSIDDKYIDYRELQIDEDMYSFKFNIDVYLTENLYEEYYNDYSELIDYYHPDAVHILHATSMQKMFDFNTVINIPSLFDNITVCMNDIDEDEEWVERRRVR
jgi:hypothetical protein